MNKPPSSPRTPVKFLAKLGYGVGDVASNIFIISTGLYLLFFLTNVLGVEPALAGLALLFPKMYDVIIDPLMGMLSDRTNTKIGRRRPYLIAAALPFGAATFALFLAVPYDSEIARAAHVGVLFAVACTAFTVFNIPYASMVAEMSDDYNERTSITSFRMIGASIGVLAAGGLGMPIVTLGGSGAPGFRLMGLVFGGLVMLLSVACFLGTRAAPFRTLPEKTVPVPQQIKIAAKNIPFLILMATYLTQSIGMGVLMAGMIYYIKIVMRMPETAMGIVFPLLLVTAVVAMPVWVKIGNRAGKIRAFRIGLLILAAGLASLFFTQSDQVELFYAQIVLVGLGFSSFQLFPFSMLPDTVEYDESRSGLRREGIFSGFWASGQKIGYAMGPAIVGAVLSASGFAKDAALQSDAVVLGVRIAFCLFPPAAILVSLLIFRKYNLTEEKFEEIKREIAASRQPVIPS